MSLVVYVHEKCSTCKEALSFLKERGLEVEIKDITREPPSEGELKKMLEVQGDVRKLFNTSGQLYRELKLSDKIGSMTEKEALKLLSKNGMLVKRPFLIGDLVRLVGFKKEKWEQALL